MTQAKASERYLALACGALPGLFLLVTSTTHLVEGQFAYDVKRLLQLVLLSLLFAVTLAVPAMRHAFAAQLARAPRWVAALAVAVALLGIVSAFVNAATSFQLAYSLLEVALLALLVLGAIAIAACRTVAGPLFDEVAITLLALTAIAVGFQELLGVAAALANDLEYFSRISLMHYSWPRFYNQVQAWCLPVLAALPWVWAQSRSELMRSRWLQAAVCLLALALNWHVILMTGGRGVALSLLIALLAGFALFPEFRRPALRWHLPGLLAGGLAFLAIGHLIQDSVSPDAATTAVETGEQHSGPAKQSSDDFARQDGESLFEKQAISGRLSLDSSGRSWLWRGSLSDIKSHPVLGIGPMNYACTGPAYRAAHPHNFPLQFAGEWGIPAALGLLALAAFMGIGLWRTSRANGSDLAPALAVGVLCAGGYSLLSGVLVMPASQVTGILILGWWLGSVPATGRMRPGARSAASVLVLAAALALSAAVCGFAWIEAGKRELRTPMISSLDQRIPRFWQEGKLCKYVDSVRPPRETGHNSS